MNIEELTKRVEAIEEKLSSLAKSDEIKGCSDERSPFPKSKWDTFERHHTVHPKDMEVGTIAYVGSYVDDEGGSYQFGADGNRIRSCLDVDFEEMAKLMEAFSKPERVNILRLLLSKRMTAFELMQHLCFKTTGKQPA